MLMHRIDDERLAARSYLVGCQASGEAIVIDPLRDVDRTIALARRHDLEIVAVAETHIHADFISGTRELAAATNARVHVSDEGDAEWSYRWLDDLGSDPRRLLDGDCFRIGSVEFEVLHTPGHTPEHVALLLTDLGAGADQPMALLSGDALFVGDLGRPDLLESAACVAGSARASAEASFRTAHRLLELPDFVQVWPAHGAGSVCGKALGAVPTSTIGYERRFNGPLLLAAAGDEAAFVEAMLADQPEPPGHFGRMKRENQEGPRLLGRLPVPARLRPASQPDLDPRHLAIIDTRPWPAFRSGHLPGSLWIPRSNRFPTEAGAFVEADEPIVLVVEASALDESVRDLVRVGLDRIAGWIEASDLEAFEPMRGPLVPLPEIGPEDAARRMADEPRLGLLDVRGAAEFAEGHLPRAVNVAHVRLAERPAELRRDRPWLVTCRSGARAGAASAYLKRAGYEVVHLAGGMLAWEQQHEEASR